ncbi:hypothetical protein NKG05_16250 [Oerskovia sp. M15]
MGHVLVVRGGWDGHAPVATTDLFIPGLEAAGHVVRVETSPEVYAEDRMGEIDLVVQCYTMGEISGTPWPDSVGPWRPEPGWSGGTEASPTPSAPARTTCS